MNPLQWSYEILAMESTSATLLNRLRRSDDQAAWVRFVELYTPLLYHWALRVGCPETDAADLVQEALLLLLRKLPDFNYDQKGSFRSWLRTVVHNCWRNLQRRAQVSVNPASSLSHLPDPAEDEPFWKADYRRHIASRALQLMQSEFQPATWQACWEMVVGGKSAIEVARQLNMSTGAVYVAKSRVLTRLRQELAGMLD